MTIADDSTIFLTAAEASGDTHAASLIAALRDRLPAARFVGVGGDRMRTAGCEILADTVSQAAMMQDVLGKLAYYRRLIRDVSASMDHTKPAVLVPVDSPALNLHFAKAARKRGIPVMYYVAPQVWAWAPWRVRRVRRVVDRLACLLPFEEAYFRARGVDATFVGHPSMDHVPRRQAPYTPAADGQWRIALLPGSRPSEIARHAAAFAEAGSRIRLSHPKMVCTFAVADERAAQAVRGLVGAGWDIAVGRTHEVAAESHLALTASGTMTVELARLGTPMVVVYRTSRPMYLAFSWWLIRTEHFSLVNILAEGELVPELIPWYGDAGAIADSATMLLASPEALCRLSQDLLALSDTLVSPHPAGAAAATADLVVRTMKRS